MVDYTSFTAFDESKSTYVTRVEDRSFGRSNTLRSHRISTNFRWCLILDVSSRLFRGDGNAVRSEERNFCCYQSRFAKAIRPGLEAACRLPHILFLRTMIWTPHSKIEREKYNKTNKFGETWAYYRGMERHVFKERYLGADIWIWERLIILRFEIIRHDSMPLIMSSWWILRKSLTITPCGSYSNEFWRNRQRHVRNNRAHSANLFTMINSAFHDWTRKDQLIYNVNDIVMPWAHTFEIERHAFKERDLINAQKHEVRKYSPKSSIVDSCRLLRSSSWWLYSIMQDTRPQLRLSHNKVCRGRIMGQHYLTNE